MNHDIITGVLIGIGIAADCALVYFAHDCRRMRNRYQEMKNQLSATTAGTLAVQFMQQMARDGARSAMVSMKDPSGEFAGGLLVVTDGELYASMIELSEMHHGRKN